MRFEIVRTVRGCRVLYVEKDRVLAGRKLKLIECRTDGTSRMIAELPSVAPERVLAKITLTRLGLRLGIHSALSIGPEEYLVVLRRRFVIVKGDGTTTDVDRIYRGNKPASRAMCRIPDGRILYGEYLLNDDRRSPIAVYRTDNPAKGFAKIYEFPAGDVRHIHFVQWDPFELCLWMGTGDRDSECRLYRSDDAGETWHLIGGGTQDWRAVGLAPTSAALFWGTDAGSDTGHTANHIVRFNRRDGTLNQIQTIQGPCHGIGTLCDETLFISTGVEGGANEVDRLVHLWASRDGHTWQEVFSRPCIWWPHKVQFGTLRIPPGTESNNMLDFTGLGLRGATETWFRGRLIED